MSEWKREGECNHCGWCCQNIGYGQMFVPRQNAFSGTSDPEYVKIRGFKETTSKGYEGHGIEVDFYNPCPAHIDSKCSIWEGRPHACSSYPLWASQIIKTPCSYWFEKDEKKVGGDGSPHPWPGTREEFNKMQSE